MQKNVSGQKWVVFAFDRTDNTPKTGDGANITANLRIDGGAANAVDDTNPTELEDGYYIFDLTQAETNGDLLLICPSSSTSDIQVIGCPPAIYTKPPNFPALGIESDGDITKVNSLDGHTAQTGDNYARLGAPAGVSVSADIATVSAKTTNLPASPAAVGDAMTLADDSIKAATYDESTAFPLASADSGATEVFRAGADGDTGETLSDQLDATATAAALAITDGKVDTIDGIVDAIVEDTGTTLPAAIAGLNDVSAADVNAACDTAISDAALATAANLQTVDNNVDAILVDTGTTLDGKLDAIQAKTDNLPAAPAATGDIPSAASIADSVWDETLTDHLGVGSTGNALNAAGSAGDPWSTALPGGYGAGSAGYILGNNLNAPVGTIDTVVDAIKAVTDNLPDGGALTTLLSNVSAILTDTGTTLPATLADISAYIDTEIAAILADTNELQGDLADGGRLDLLIDAIKAVTDALPDGGALTTLLANLADVLTDTGTTIPAQISGLNNLSAAEVNAECDTAITDAALATAANLQTVADNVDAIKATTDKLDDTLELDGAEYRFTTNALEQAPSGGGGGDATAANQDTIITHLTDIKGTGFVKDTHSMTNVTGGTATNITVETSAE